ncbi:RNA polymerase sigma factor [Heliobacterium mobile]|uniref:RNA polymerase sigma factor n=1 Tax=Heliobacterium mobile TaxID=28064 RepID=UPI001478B326|nr:RNA polymerase sigma factor [Heliobacterium mobile]
MEVESMIERFKAGDIEGLRLIYERCYKPVYQAAFFVTRDAGLAEDVTHDVFLKLGEKIDQLREPSKLEAWLCQMAANTARDLLRRRVRSVLCAEVRENATEMTGDSPESAALEEEERALIRRCVSDLPQEYRSVIYLKYYRDQTIEQISSALDIPSGSVKSRLSRAKQRIKKWLERDGQIKRHSVEDINNETIGRIAEFGKENTYHE